MPFGPSGWPIITPSSRVRFAAAADSVHPPTNLGVRSSNLFGRTTLSPKAPVAQLDRAPDFEFGGQGFESLPAHHYFKGLSGIDRSPAAANSPLVRYHQRAKFKTQFRVFAAQFLVV